MTDQAQAERTADDMVAEADTGARNPIGWQGQLIIGTCIVWSLFQLYIASKLPGVLAPVDGHVDLRQHRRTGALRAPGLCHHAGDAGLSAVQNLAPRPHSALRLDSVDRWAWAPAFTW